MNSIPPESLPAPANGHENQGTLINAFAWWKTVVAFTFVAFRLYTTLAIVKARLWFDDWHILAAMMGSFISAALTSAEVSQGFGRHEHYLSREDVSNYLALNYGSWIVFYITMMCTNVSVCFFLLKLPLHHTVRKVLWTSIIGIIISSLVIVLFWALQCVPPNAAWDFGTSGTCLSRSTVLQVILAQGILSAICDYLLALCPLAIIWRLALMPKHCYGLCTLMGLGVIVGSCCVVRAFLNYQALPDDTTYTFITYWFWRLFEMQLGIICACVPALSPLNDYLLNNHSGEERTSSKILTNAVSNQSLHHFTNTRLPNGSAHSEQSEKAFLGQAAIFKPDEVEAQNKMMERPLPAAPQSDARRKSDLRTFWTDESMDEIPLGAAPRYRPLPPTAAVGKDVSFSTRDRVRHQTVIPARPTSPLLEPPDVLITTPYGETKRGVSHVSALPASTPSQLSVETKGGDGLDIDLTPSFQRHRSTFGRILGMQRASWRSSMFSMYSARSNGDRGQRPGEGRGLMHDFV